NKQAAMAAAGHADLLGPRPGDEQSASAAAAPVDAADAPAMATPVRSNAAASVTDGSLAAGSPGTSSGSPAVAAPLASARMGPRKKLAQDVRLSQGKALRLIKSLSKEIEESDN
ncbi:unnamed protein product, partial [Prorocentrum cordatum]